MLQDGATGLTTTLSYHKHSCLSSSDILARGAIITGPEAVSVCPSGILPWLRAGSLIMRVNWFKVNKAPR